MAALISGHPVQKINRNPLHSLQSCTSLVLKIPDLSCCVEPFFINFIGVFGGILQYNMETRKQKFL